MKNLTIIKTLTCVVMLLGFTVTSNGQAYIRADRYGSTTSDVGRGIVSDADGSYYVTGYFTGTVNFGGGNLVSAGNRDIFIAKYSTIGAYVWAVRVGGANDDEGASVAIDKGDSVYVTGYYSGTGTTGNFATTVSWGNHDIFVHKLSKTNGAAYSLYQAGSAANDEGMGVAFNNKFNTLYVTGYYNNNCKFDVGAPIAASNEDVFTINLDPTLKNVWTRTGSSAGNDRGHSICTDDSGRVYITGYTTGNATFSGKTIASYGNSDVFFVKYGGAGNIMGIQRAGSAANDAGNGITCDAVGTIYVTGYHSNNATFGAAALAATAFDVFITKLDYTLAFVASVSPGSAGNDAGQGIIYDPYCNTLYTTGYANTGIDFGGGARAFTNVGVFLLRSDIALARVWDNVSSGALDEKGMSVSSNGSKRIMVTGGYTSNDLWFSAIIRASAGAEDIFVCEFQEPGAACAGGGAPVMFDQNTNIQNVATFDEINMYPNPTNNIVNINSKEIITQLNVVDLAGKIITNLNPNSYTATIDLTDFPNGIYIVNLKINNQQLHKKLIKE